MDESAYAGGIYSVSSITVNGGTFYKFNPADNLAEGANTNFVSENHAVNKEDDWYSVTTE